MTRRRALSGHAHTRAPVLKCPTRRTYAWVGDEANSRTAEHTRPIKILCTSSSTTTIRVKKKFVFTEKETEGTQIDQGMADEQSTVEGRSKVS